MKIGGLWKIQLKNGWTFCGHFPTINWPTLILAFLWSPQSPYLFYIKIANQAPVHYCILHNITRLHQNPAPLLKIKVVQDFLGHKTSKSVAAQHFFLCQDLFLKKHAPFFKIKVVQIFLSKKFGKRRISHKLLC